jgi:hypothetical protein
MVPPTWNRGVCSGSAGTGERVASVRSPLGYTVILAPAAQVNWQRRPGTARYMHSRKSTATEPGSVTLVVTRSSR